MPESSHSALELLQKVSTKILKKDLTAIGDIDSMGLSTDAIICASKECK